MSATAPSSPDARSHSVIAGIVLAFLAVGAGWWIWREPEAAPSRPAPGDLVLDETIDATFGPIDRRLLAPGPAIFSIELTPPMDVTVTLGPPLPSTNSAEGGPDPASSTVLHGTAGKRITADVRVYGAGIQVLRIEPSGLLTLGGRAGSLRVRRRAGP